MKKPKKAIVKSKTLSSLLSIPPTYKLFFEDVKNRIRTTQIKAATSFNKELILLYWSIGRDLVEKQEKEEWGSRLIEKFGIDIQKNCPGVGGFSRENIFKMRAFFLSSAKVAQAVRLFEELPIFCTSFNTPKKGIMMSKTHNGSSPTLEIQSALPTGYPSILEELKRKIKKSQTKALISVNLELISVYWEIGKTIHEQQQTASWDSSVVRQLAKDLQRSFPGSRGYSLRNIYTMRNLYTSYHDKPKMQTLSAQISWSHVIILDLKQNSRDK